MTVISILSLTLVMLALAAVPSASVVLVVTRSATLGFRHGAAVAAGIVIGDLGFVTLAILGMGFLAETMGAFFAVFRLVGGAYLVWLGIGLWRARGDAVAAPVPETAAETVDSRGSSLGVSLLSGLCLTLGDVKAILFYASLFPAFVDLGRLTPGRVAVIAGVTILAVGGVKLLYALSARRIADRIRSRRAPRGTRVVAGGVLVGAGGYLIAKT